MSGTIERDVAIVGSGFSGLCMAIQLQREGKRSFVVLEKGEAIGGTWRDNHYPGCACDVPSHLYSFSFALEPDWSRAFSPYHEIRSYMERCVDRYSLRPHIRLGSEVISAVFDEETGRWRVRIRGGAEVSARYLVLAAGFLSRPAYPHIEGLQEFRGRAFHSAQWDHGYELAGKRVAVIGTGASAIQFVPQIAPKVGRLHLFQRTAPWVMPKPDREFSRPEKLLFRHVPGLQRAYRWWIYWLFELRALGFTVEPRLMKLIGRIGERHIRRQIADPALRAAVTPSYLPGCKRILLANDYYPALQRDNVELVTDSIERITPAGIVTAGGRERPIDAIIFGTGFDVTDVLGQLRVVGRRGLDLATAWGDGASAYLGTAIAGFPNLFMLLGPNTGLGHNSMIFMIEAQVHYVLSCMRAVERRGARWIEVLERQQAAFNEALKPRLARSVWASGCNSWYLDAMGRNITVWPAFTAEFWLRTRRLMESHYRFERAGAAERVAERPGAAL